MRISELMTGAVHCISPDQTIDDAARMMVEHDVGAIPVVIDDKPIGVITDRDIVTRAVAQNRDPARTVVRQVMSGRAVCCSESDTVHDAALLMEAQQVRRLLVVDSRGCITGIVSLGDLAVRGEDDELAEDVLEQVSMPTSDMRHLRRHLLQPWNGKRMITKIVKTPTDLIITAFAGALAGAALMFAFDPSRGRRRRALMRDKMVHVSRVARQRAGKTIRRTRDKAQGLICETRSKLAGSANVTDERLRERVRSAMGRVVSHPHAITVDCEDCIITLQGQIPQHEVQSLIGTTLRVPGVRRVINHLQPQSMVEPPSRLHDQAHTQR